jgi:Neuraminidase (sialidase)
MEANYANSAEKIGQTTKDKLGDFAHSAAEKIERGRVGTADTLENAATTVRTKGGEAGAAITDLSGKAATNLDSSARYVRNADMGQVWSDMAGVARRHPGAIAFGAIVAGFCMGRMMTRHSHCCNQVQDT